MLNMSINFWVSLIVGVVVSFLSSALGYTKESLMFLIEYLLVIFIYRMIVKLTLKNKKFYEYLLDKLYEDENLERKFIIFCIVIDLIRLAIQIYTIHSCIQTNATWLGFYITTAFAFRLASISVLIHIVLLLKSMRKKGTDGNTVCIIYRRSFFRRTIFALTLILCTFFLILLFSDRVKLKSTTWAFLIVLESTNALYVMNLQISKIEFCGTRFLYKSLFKKLEIESEQIDLNQSFNTDDLKKGECLLYKKNGEKIQIEKFIKEFVKFSTKTKSEKHSLMSDFILFFRTESLSENADNSR